MSRSRVVISLLAVLIAIVLQTTVFGAGRLEPFGVAPALVTLVVLGVSVQIEAEYLLMVGFTAGILMDLIGSGTLGLWAMTLTAVAYAAGRLKAQLFEGPGHVAMVVFGLTVGGQLLYVVLGTLFGQGTIAEPGVAWKIILPGVWNLILVLPVFWILGRAFKSRQSGWAV
ncbi:MAG: rod shape-determining protein MreD [Actinomycetota bacterium]